LKTLSDFSVIGSGLGSACSSCFIPVKSTIPGFLSRQHQV
jgi:hypothetical protein